MEGAQQKNIQTGRKDCHIDNLSNPERCPAVSAGRCTVFYLHLLAVFFLFLAIFVVAVAFLLVVCCFCCGRVLGCIVGLGAVVF